MATKAPPAKEAPKPAEKTATKDASKDDKAKAPAPGKDDGKAPASKEPPKDDKTKAAAAKEAPKDDKAKAPAPGKDDGKAPASKDPPKDDKSKAPTTAAGKDATATGKDKNGAPVQGQANPENRASVSNTNQADAKQMGNFFDALDNPDQQHGDSNHEAKNEEDEDDDSGNLHPIPTDDPKEIQKRKSQAEMFKKYLDNTGVSMAFQIIYAEILAKKITTENVFSYTAMRLRQIGSDLAAISVNKQKK